MKDFFYRLLRFPVDLLRALFSTPGQLFSSGKRMLGLSLPGRVAVLLFLFLLVCVIISFVAFLYDPFSAFWKAVLGRRWFVPTLLGLVVVIPIVLYYTLKLWLEGEASPYEDIDRAWKAGLDELERQGLDIAQIPIFLILGSSGEAQEKAMFQSARLSLNVKELPQGPAPIHWYANPDGIYIACTGVGCLSRLAASGKGVADEDRSRAGPVAPSPGAGGIRGTIVAGGSEGFPDPYASPASMASGPLPPGPPGGIYGTMVVSHGSVVGGEAPAGGGSMRPITLPDEEAAEQERRLEYLCSLIHRVRRPICPVNGILTLLPFGLIQRGPREGIEVQRTAKRDLAAVLRACKVRCPVTAVVAGMESESGFRELVRRVGLERAGGQRFGKGFTVENPPLPERIEALCAHACGAFEDWVYTLFRDKDALSKPGNTKLYAMLCNIRRNVQTRLGNILVDAYGADLDREPNAEYFFFSGCYFAATGETPDRQAFVKGVFDKLPDEQANLQWTDAALEEDARCQRLAYWVMAYDLLMLAALAGMVVYLVLPRK